MPHRRLLALVVLCTCLVFSTLLTAQSALQFVSVPPCRVVDTRWQPGPFGGPSIAGNSSRDFAIPQGSCNIPATAAAYALNVTVVPQGSLGYLTIWPTGQQKPVISTLNSLDGRTKANAAIVPAGASGAISVYVTDSADVVLDINGYFVPGTNTTLAFFPITPCRVADTRWANGSLGGPFLAGGLERSFPILASTCNLPNFAAAYSLNFTAVPKGGPLSYLTVWPAGSSRPIVSTLNAPTGAVTANAAIMPAGVQGAITVYPTNDTNLVIDIDGYFALSASGPGPLSLYTLLPCRVLDTRPPHGNGTFSGLMPVGVLQSPCNVPSAQAYVLNATVIPQNGGFYGYLTLWPDTEGQPLVSTLNALDGMITSNMAIVPTLNGDVDAYASNMGNLVLDIFSYFAPIGPLNITTTSLPSGTVSYGYTTTLGATGGVMPYTWSLSAGSLPAGLNLDPASGTISGTPTMSGDSQFNVQVTDSESPAQAVAEQFDIQVNAGITQLSIVTTGLPQGTQNAGYNTMLAATGGITPYTWSIVAGTLPSGLQLNSSTGAIIGTASGAGVSNFTVQVADAEGPPATASKPLSITINPAVPLQITTTSLPNGVAGTLYSAPITAIGGVYPYTWSVISGKIPDGLTLNSGTGVLAGTPQNVGVSNFTIQVIDTETPPVSTTVQLSLTINSPGGNGNPGLLSGNYAFELNGFSASGQFTLAGSFISDGNGHITSGVVDGNPLAGQPFTSNVTGTYSISTAGLNLITLQGQSYGPATFAFVLSSSGNGRIIEYDDTTGQGSRGSGVLRKANPSAFSLGALNGNWVLGVTGGDRTGRFVDAGVFTLASGNISNGESDVNDTGTYVTGTFTGNLPAVDSQTGRGVATIQTSFGDVRHEAMYVISSTDMIIEQIDATPNSGIPVAVGLVLMQSGTLNNSSLNGLSVASMQDVHGGDGLDQSIAALFSFNGNGSINILAMDEDLAGTITQDQPSQGTYTVQSNGALDFGSGNPAGFVISQNKAFFVGRGSSTIFGIMEPQSGGPFSNASIAGTYVAGSLAPLDYNNGRNEILAGSADGAGNMVFNGDSSNANGIGQYFGINVTYSLAGNGRGTAIGQGDQLPSVVYVISPTKFVVLMPQSDAEIAVFEH